MSTSPNESPAAAIPSPAAALDRGDVVNLLARFRDRLREEGRKLTVVQNRLIMQRVEAAGLASAGGLRAERQIEKIASVVAELVAMEVEVVEEELRACMG